jgi:hypothetical protein
MVVMVVLVSREGIATGTWQVRRVSCPLVRGTGSGSVIDDEGKRSLWEDGVGRRWQLYKPSEIVDSCTRDLH